MRQRLGLNTKLYASSGDLPKPNCRSISPRTSYATDLAVRRLPHRIEL